MTEKEYQQVWKQLKERQQRTSFPASGSDNPREVYEAHGGHATYGESQH
jgi:hypothetical protein